MTLHFPFMMGIPREMRRKKAWNNRNIPVQEVILFDSESTVMKIDCPVKKCHFGLVPYPTWYLSSGVAGSMAYTTDRFAALHR